MTRRNIERLSMLAILPLAIAAPFVFPNYMTFLTFIWIMIVLALTWDVLGGQMGYNSFGNILFFGIGVYATTIVQIGLFADVGAYTAAYGVETIELTRSQFLIGLAVGLVAAPVLAVVAAAILGSGLLGLRGQYFGIGTLGLGIAGGELAAAWGWIGGAFGVQVPVFPGEVLERRLLFYFLAFVLAAATFLLLRRLYAGRFGLLLNAIRDDEDKAEAMGLYTTRYKTIAWCVAAFFLAIAGGLVGQINGYIDPREVAFAGASFGIWMILMAILGGKGTIWGPVIGAVLFYLMKEVFWQQFFGWQRVALGLLIVVIVVFFPVGIIGWLKQRFPERFGHKVDEEKRATAESAGSGSTR
jgi:branched-chain amino acid transport system permease protein